MASVSLHQVDGGYSKCIGGNGNYKDGSGGWITLRWGGVEVSLHYDDADELMDVLLDCETQLGQNTERCDYPETNRTERDEQPPVVTPSVLIAE